MNSTNVLLASTFTALCLASSANAQTAAMTVSSSSFTENGVIPPEHGGSEPGCGGKGMAPQVSWSHLPAGTKSVAVLMFDPDGAKGLGVSHWVAYNIAAERGQLKQGEGQTDGHGATVGKNISGGTAYRGPCPPVGEAPHHYILTVVATDLAPSALPQGLTRDELLAALKGHAIAGQSIVGRYAR